MYLISQVLEWKFKMKDQVIKYQFELMPSRPLECVSTVERRPQLYMKILYYAYNKVVGLLFLHCICCSVSPISVMEFFLLNSVN